MYRLKPGPLQKAASERKKVISNLKIKEVKTLINILGYIIENEDYEKNDTLARYVPTFRKLLDKQISLADRKQLLQKAGHIYVPILLDIIGDDMQEFEPRYRKRNERDCPLCKSKGLKKLSNHLKQVHGIKERCNLLKQAKENNIAPEK